MGLVARFPRMLASRCLVTRRLIVLPVDSVALVALWISAVWARSVSRMVPFLPQYSFLWAPL